MSEEGSLPWLTLKRWCSCFAAGYGVSVCQRVGSLWLYISARLRVGLYRCVNSRTTSFSQSFLKTHPLSSASRSLTYRCHLYIIWDGMFWEQDSPERRIDAALLNWLNLQSWIWSYNPSQQHQKIIFHEYKCDQSLEEVRVFIAQRIVLIGWAAQVKHL